MQARAWASLPRRRHNVVRVACCTLHRHIPSGPRSAHAAQRQAGVLPMATEQRMVASHRVYHYVNSFLSIMSTTRPAHHLCLADASQRLRGLLLRIHPSPAGESGCPALRAIRWREDRRLDRICRSAHPGLLRRASSHRSSRLSCVYLRKGTPRLVALRLWIQGIYRRARC